LQAALQVDDGKDDREQRDARQGHRNTEDGERQAKEDHHESGHADGQVGD
jgi:hypothetical protein